MTGPLANRYTRLLGIRHPVVQEGMGPFRTARLAAAVSEAGGLGTVSVPGAVGDLDVAAVDLRRSVEECASLTSRPFAVNIPVGQRRGGVAPSALRYLDTVLEARRADGGLERQLRVLTTSAGFPEGLTSRLHDEGLLHQHKVGSTRHARKAAAAGVDAVIAAGFEMGGHAPTSRMHTFVLVPNVADAVDVPVVLTGGVRDGRGLAAALCLGADAVALGTRFAATRENTEWSAGYREAVLAAEESQDMVIDGVFGPCRVLRNTGAEEIAAAQAEGRAHAAEKIAAMRLAQIEGDVERGLVLMGQVASGITETASVGELIERMVDDAAAALGRRTASSRGAVTWT
ncbi:nitronate monooxygenase [Pseudonocardia sp. NPDC049154]|uniref:NAD(P)H-dependent flavin oxidoreductase n=1 Tax=Pseudonocardia sp. NPDC049154 TaxID=3155501 RepID=UPI0033F000D3